MDENMKKRFDGISGMISNTPLLEIQFLFKGQKRRIFAKAEAFNLTGSIKDRVAYYILKKAYETGAIHPGDKIAEATSGNTGISFSAMGRYLGHDVIIYMPDWMSKERINLMRGYGAQVRLVSKEEGGFLGSIAMTEKLAEAGGVFLPRQFSNEDNAEAHYLMTGDEIARQLASLDLQADGVVAGVGTGGTVMGIGRRLRKANPNCQIYPLEPLNSPTLSTGYKVGKHRIQGISDEFVPDILKMSEVNDVISVDDTDSIIMSQMLARVVGIGVGIFSEANFIGCIMAQEKLGAESIIATVFADDNKKYLSTDYSEKQEMKEQYISHDVQLMGVIAHR